MIKKDLRRYRKTQHVVIKDYKWHLERADPETQERAKRKPLTIDDIKKIRNINKMTSWNDIY